MGRVHRPTNMATTMATTARIMFAVNMYTAKKMSTIAMYSASSRFHDGRCRYGRTVALLKAKLSRGAGRGAE